METIKKLFTEIFRPTDLKNVILPSRIYSDLSNGLIQNTFLYGPAGSGKTTIARILTQGYDCLKLNGSSENGIDIIRNKVVNFSSTISLSDGIDKMKVIYIDEADGLTDAAWDALRETIERYAENTRFICTCNKIEKIPVPIKSRFKCIPVYPINKEEEDVIFDAYITYVGKILNGIHITYTDEVLNQFIHSYFPDMRSILNTIQTLYIQQATTLDRNSLIKTFDCNDLFNIILTENSNPVENYKFIMENYSTVPDDAMLEISKNFIEYLRHNYDQYNNKIPLLIIAIAEYINQLKDAIDKVIVLLACVYKLQLILFSK